MLLTLAIVAVIFLSVFTYLQARLAVFRALRMVGPDPIVLIGNLWSFRGKSSQKVLTSWSRQYGRIYGYYEGGRPVLVTSDPDWAKEVLVKKFSNFAARKLHPLVSLANANSSGRLNLMFAAGPNWKRLRTFVAATLNQNQLPQTTPAMLACIKSLLERFDVDCRTGEDFDIHQSFRTFAVDVMSRCAFGLEGNSQMSAAIRLHCQRAATASNRPFSHLLAALWPEFRPIIRLAAKVVAKVYDAPHMALTKLLLPLVTQMQSDQLRSERPNLLRFLLDSELSEEIATDNRLKLSTEEVAAQAVLFLLAGVEATATSLSHLALLLSEYPAVQQKLQTEVDEMDMSGAANILESVNDLPYLAQVINESLRLCPAASPLVARHCISPCLIRGQGVPEGLTVAIDVWSLHRNKDLWGVDADSFRPERFNLPLPHSAAFLPFGCGPRSCPGMKFALAEIKLALVALLRRYTIIRPSLLTRELPKFQANLTCIQPAGGIWLRLEQRSSQAGLKADTGI